jgi:hypothetical protein
VPQYACEILGTKFVHRRCTGKGRGIACYAAHTCFGSCAPFLSMLMNGPSQWTLRGAHSVEEPRSQASRKQAARLAGEPHATHPMLCAPRSGHPRYRTKRGRVAWYFSAGDVTIVGQNDVTPYCSRFLPTCQTRAPSATVPMRLQGRVKCNEARRCKSGHCDKSTRD